MEIIALIAIAVIYSVGCLLSYSEEYRRTSWFIWVGGLIGILINVIWFSLVKYLDDKQKIYIFGLIWDSIMMLIYYLLPMLVFGVKLNKISLFALSLIVCGMVILKIKG